MMRLPGPRAASRRGWIATMFAAALCAWFAWPAAEPAADIVEVAHPRRTPSSPGKVRTNAPGYAQRASAITEAKNLFASHSWYVAPPPPPPQNFAPPAPTAPPLPFTFLGSYSRAGEPAVYFLVKGDRIFDAHIGDVLEKQYSLDAAEGGQLHLTYLPLGIKQSLAVGVVQ